MRNEIINKVRIDGLKCLVLKDDEKCYLRTYTISSLEFLLNYLLEETEEEVLYKDFKNFDETGKICTKIEGTYNKEKKTIKVKIPKVREFNMCGNKYAVQFTVDYEPECLIINYKICAIDDYVLIS